MIKLGQRLHDKRIQKGLTLDDVTKATKIRPAFLRAIEHGEYHKLPESSYAQGFIANYADYLGLSKRETLALFRREFDEAKAYALVPRRFAEPVDTSFSKFKIQHTTLVVFLIFFVFIFYLIYAYRDVFINPTLAVGSNEIISTETGEVTVKGKASKYDLVTVNNQPTFVNGDGSFSKTVSVFPDEKEITVKAVNRFGRETIVKKTITAR